MAPDLSTTGGMSEINLEVNFVVRVLMVKQREKPFNIDAVDKLAERV
jgi:hypothetical protein